MKHIGAFMLLDTILTMVLGVVFIILKLADIIDWNWFWVLSPIWANFVIMAIIFFVLFVYLLIKEG